jgi:hypothetical protein
VPKDAIASALAKEVPAHDPLRERIARVLGMLGSDHPGERDNAAKLAEQLRRETGLTWRELLGLTR